MAGFAHRVLGGTAQKRLRRTRTIAPSTTPARRASVRARSLEAACFAAILRALASSFFTVFRWFLEERTATGWTPTASNAIFVASWKAGCTAGGSSLCLGLDRGGVRWRSVLGSGGVRPRSPPAPHLSRGPGPTDIDRCERIEPGPDINRPALMTVTETAYAVPACKSRAQAGTTGVAPGEREPFRSEATQFESNLLVGFSAVVPCKHPRW